MRENYNPDKWALVRINMSGEIIYKVLGSWYSGYTQGQSWRLNSGITAALDQGDHYDFVGNSGSRYICPKGLYGMNLAASGIISSMIESARDKNIDVRVLEEDDIEEVVALLS